MPPSAARRCLPVFLFSIFINLVPVIRSQELRRAEVSAHFQDAVRELARENHLDRTTENSLRAALRPGFLLPKDSPVNVRKAQTSIARYLEADKFGLQRHGERLDILGRPERKYDFATRQRLSLELVESFSSVIRRRSVVAEIGTGIHYELSRAELGPYLRDTLKIHDYEQVRDSFDSTMLTSVITLKKDTQLLRIYGGESKPIGRYFFCCLWTPDTRIQGTRWSDASGLATPPGNLRERLAVVTVPAGTTVIVGTVADNFTDELGIPRRGGNAQVFVPEVKTSAFQEYRLKGTNAAPSEILVVSDDGILRFRPKVQR